MEANELRIGNLIEYRIQDDLDDRKDWWEVSKIDATDLCILESNIDYDFRPIPLTEEWLLKFGFKKYGKTTLFKKSNVTLNSMDIGHNRGDGFTLNYIPFVKVQHVNQLQNLYFALTGEELTFKNPLIFVNNNII